MHATMSNLYHLATAFFLLQACSAVDIRVYSGANCGGDYSSCTNANADTCCFTASVIESCDRTDGGTIQGFAKQGTTICGVSLGFNSPCFDYSEDPIMQGCKLSDISSKRTTVEGKPCKRQEADSFGMVVDEKRFKVRYDSPEYEQLSAIESRGEKKLFMKRFGTLDMDE